MTLLDELFEQAESELSGKQAGPQPAPSPVQNQAVSPEIDSLFYEAESDLAQPPAKGVLGAIASGAKRSMGSLGVTYDLYTGDDAGALEGIGKTAAIPSTVEQQRFHQVKEEEMMKRGDEDWLSAIKSVGVAAWKEKMGALHETAAQIPNHAILLTSMYAGAKIGAAASPFLGPAAPAGPIIGGIAGMIVGDVAIETGFIAQEKMAGPSYNYDRSDLLLSGGKKGLVIAAFDTLTLGIGKFMFSGPGKAARNAVLKTLSDEGVDVTSRVAVEQAIRGNKELLRKAMAAGTVAAEKAAPKGVKNIGIHAADLTMEMAGETAGDYLGSVAAGIDASMTDAVMEGMMSIPQSAAHVGIAKSLGGAKSAIKRTTGEKPAPDSKKPPVDTDDLMGQMIDDEDAGEGGEVPPGAGPGPGIEPEPGGGALGGKPRSADLQKENQAVIDQLVQQGLFDEAEAELEAEKKQPPDEAEPMPEPAPAPEPELGPEPGGAAAESKKDKAIREYKEFVTGLPEDERKAVSSLIIDNPEKPGMQKFKIQKAVAELRKQKKAGVRVVDETPSAIDSITRTTRKRELEMAKAQLAKTPGSERAKKLVEQAQRKVDAMGKESKGVDELGPDKKTEYKSQYAGQVFKHFTTKKAKEALERGEGFDFDKEPIHGTGSLDDGPKTNRFAGKNRIYLSLDDSIWGKKSRREGEDQVVDVTPDNAKELEASKAEFFYDYKNQKWQAKVGAKTVVDQLDAVDFRLAKDARVKVIDSDQALKDAGKEVDELPRDNPVFWDKLARKYDAVAIINTKKNAVKSKFFRQALGDQIIVLNPDKAVIEGPAGAVDELEQQLAQEEREAVKALPGYTYLKNMPQGKKDTFGVDQKLFKSAVTPEGFEKDTDNNFIHLKNEGGRRTVESAFNEIYNLETGTASSIGKMRQGGKAARAKDASPLLVIDNFRRTGKLKIAIEQWKKLHPEGWKAYQERQERLKDVKVGEIVLAPYPTPENDAGSEWTVIRKNKKTWTLKDSYGAEIRVVPEALRPAEKSEAKPAQLPIPESKKARHERIQKKIENRKARAETLAKEYQGKPIVLSDETGTSGVIIHKSTKKDGAFQVTRWDEKGFSGDTMYETIAKAIDEAFTDGYENINPEAFERISKTRKFQKYPEALRRAQKIWAGGDKGGPAIELPPTETAPEIISIKGKTAKTYLPDNTEVEIEYAVTDINSLIASHDTDLSPNPNYPKELQPRDRSRDALKIQVDQIANKLNPERLGESASVSSGAPIVGPDMIVESGNGRAIAIEKAYGRESGKTYKAWLEKNAEKFGLTKDDISAIENPVLVRVRKTEVENRADFAKKANQSDTAVMGPAETARADSERLTDKDMQIFAPSEEGDISAASNRTFINRFLEKLGTNEAAGFLTADGRYTKQLIDRIQAAIFYRAYQNDELVTLMAEEADPGVKNLLNALTVAAPKFVRARNLDEKRFNSTKIVDHIVGGIKIIKEAKDNESVLEDYLRQGRMFGDKIPGPTQKIALFIDKNKRTAKRQGIFFKNVAEKLYHAIENRGNKALPGMEFDAIDISEIVDNAIQIVRELYESGQQQVELFGDSVQERTGGSEQGGYRRTTTGLAGATGGPEGPARGSGKVEEFKYAENTFLKEPSKSDKVKFKQAELPFGRPESKSRAQDLPALSRNVVMRTTGRIDAEGNIVSRPADAAALLSFLNVHPQEKAYAIAVDANGSVLQIHEYSKGTKGAASISAIEIAGPILNLPAVSHVYFVHNHPSGSIKPSDADRYILSRVKDLLSLQDVTATGMIVAGNTYDIFLDHDNGRPPMPKTVRKAIRKTTLPVQERRYKSPDVVTVAGEGPSLGNHREVWSYFNDKYHGAEGFLFVNAQNKPLGMMPMPIGKSGKEAAAEIVKTADFLNATAAVIVLNKEEGRKAFIENVQRLIAGDLTIHDVILQGDTIGHKFDIRSAYKPGAPQLLNKISELHETKSDAMESEKAEYNLAGVSIDDIRNLPMFKNRAVGIAPNGTVWVRLNKRDTLGIKGVTGSKQKVKIHLGLVNEKTGEAIAGKYDGTIELSLIADKSTLAHEIEHALEDMGYINRLDQAILDNAIKKAWGKDATPGGISVEAMEARARFVADALQNREKWRNTAVGRVIQKILDFIDGIIGLAYRSAKGVIRDVESGKVLDRTEEAGVFDFAASPAHSLRKAAERVMDNPNFKKWFGNSKVVDENGEPLVVYHGTVSPEIFKEFRTRGIDISDSDLTNPLGDNDAGAFFTSNPETANDFAQRGRRGQEKLTTKEINEDKYLESARIYSAYVSLQNPKIFNKVSDYLEFKRNNFNSMQFMLERDGYDGIILKDANLYESGTDEVWAIAFNPTQIKSIYNRGTFSETDPHILHERSAPRWYSEMVRVLGQKLPKTGNPKIYRDTINAWARKGEFKQEELDWSGLIPWLEQQEGKISKQAVMDYLAANQLEIREVEKGGDSIQKDEKVLEIAGELFEEDFNRDNQQWLEYMADYYLKEANNAWENPDHIIWEHVWSNKDEYIENAEGDEQQAKEAFRNDVLEDLEFNQIMYSEDLQEIKEQAWESYKDDYIDSVSIQIDEGDIVLDSAENAPKFSEYQLPGGENYRELLITLPYQQALQSSAHKEWKKLQGQMQAKYGENWLLNMNEVEQRRYDKLTAGRDQEPGSVYKSSHWAEPNVLAHVRFNERTGANGDRVLFLEEIQSDWHQEGRKKGYKGQAKWEVQQLPDGKWSIGHGRTGIPASFPTKAQAEAFLNSEKFKQQFGDGPDAGGVVPDAPFKTTWPMLIMKRIVRYAAENGFDTVAWTPGEVQAERYNMSKQVSFIESDPFRDTFYVVIGLKEGSVTSIDLKVDSDGKILDSTHAEFQGKNLDDVIGKEMADKALSAKEVTTFEGQDLKVGGEGMKAFYDRILPNEVNKFFNKGKWGKAKVGEVKLSEPQKFSPEKREVGDQEGTWVETPEIVTKGLTAHALPITPEMRHRALAEGMPLFEIKKLPSVIEQNFGKKEISLKDVVNTAIKAVGTDPQARKELYDLAITQGIDRLHPIKELGGEKAYMLHRLETGSEGVFAMLLEHGKLVKDESGLLRVDTRGEGFLPFLRSLGNDWHRFFYWVAAKRAEQLEAEGREKRLNKEARDKIFEWAGGRNNRRWIDAAKKLHEFNSSVLDVAEESGLINADDRSTWEQFFYVPFYRVFEDEAARAEFMEGPHKSRKFISAQIRQLKGSERKLGDPLENLLHNWMHLISESIRNEARAEAFRFAEEQGTGIVERVKKSDLLKFRSSKDKKLTYVTKQSEDNVLVFQEDGSPVYFKVNDPVFFQALSGINSPSFDNFMVKIMRQSKRWLTYGATFGPGFRIANLLRDTMHTALMEQSFIPFYDSAIGFWKSLREDEDYIKFMASGAGFGSSYVEADNPKIAAKFINRVLESEGKEAGERILDTPKKMLDFWQKIGSASENAARVRLYQKLTKEGYSHMDAAFRARDLLDFTMSGQSRTVQFLIQTVPFLNARVQGLYKLGRANPFTNKENRKNFLLWGGMLVAASMALWFWNRDRDEYEELEDWDKWTYYHFWIGDKHYRIPKPFEVGAIFSSFPETILDAMNGNNEAKHIADFIAHTATETFALGLPQIFTPALEQWANQSFFTGRPIVGERLENLEPGEQKEPWTSETMQVIGRVFNVSPKRAEALINGYFSTFGMFLLTGSDILLHHLMDFPADPTKRIEDYPGIGRFVREKGPARYTRYQTWFYDTVNEMDRTMQTIRQYIQTGEVDKGQKKALNNKEMLKLRSEFHKVRTVLGEINQEMRRVLYDKEMSGKEKREKIDQLYEQKNKLTKQMYEVYAGKIKK